MPETKVVQIFFRCHFVTPPTENALKYRCVNIQHNFNMYKNLLTIHGYQWKLCTYSMIEFSQKKKLNYIWCLGVIPPTHFSYHFGFVILATECHFRLLCLSYMDYDYEN